MTFQDLNEFVRAEARRLKISDSELARRANISRTALIKIFNGEVSEPSLTTLANLAYAIQANPHHLFALFMSGRGMPERKNWKVKHDASRFVRDVNYPDGDLVIVGQTFEKKWEIANAGQVPWIGRRLVCQDQVQALYRKAGDDYQVLTYQLLPHVTDLPIPFTQCGESVELAVSFTAPDTPAYVVSYWKIADQNGKICYPESEGLRCCVNVIRVD